MAHTWMTSHSPLRLVLTLAAAWAFGGCAPDPDPFVSDLGILAPDLGDGPDADAPDTGRPDAGEPDSGRLDMSGRDLGSDARADMGDCTLECGTGSCALDEAGAEICLCDAPFAGADCGECLRGYAGTACDECAVGFIADPVAAGACVPDPCDAGPCGANGSCGVEIDRTGAAAPACTCDPGFEGDACDACAEGHTGADCDVCDVGYTLENGLCVLIVCSPFPCGDHGACMDDGAGGSDCICDFGWTGRACGTCAVGFILENGGCVLDACSGLACVHGSCVVPVGAAATCDCEVGYTGAACDSCDFGYTEVMVGSQTECLNTLPVRDARVLGWFDGKRPDQMDFVNGDQVKAWHSSTGGAGPFYATNADAVRPRYVILPKAGVSFDGGDWMVNYTELYGDTAQNFTTFAIVTWNFGGQPSTLLNTFAPASLQEVARVQASGGGYAGFVSDAYAIEHYNFNPTGPRLMRWSRNPVGNAIAHSLSSGGTDSTTLAATPPPSVPDYRVYLGGELYVTPGDGLSGTMHELVFIVGTLTNAERDAIEAYLTLKWGL